MLSRVCCPFDRVILTNEELNLIFLKYLTKWWLFERNKLNSATFYITDQIQTVLRISRIGWCLNIFSPLYFLWFLFQLLAPRKISGTVQSKYMIWNVVLQLFTMGTNSKFDIFESYNCNIIVHPSKGRNRSHGNDDVIR